MAGELAFDVVRAEDLSPTQRAEIIHLCSTAYKENFDHFFDLLPGSTHVRACLGKELVSHAAWVTRWLQLDEGQLLRTAYVEAVATATAYQRRGFGTAVMRKLAEHIGDYDLGALSPSDPVFYERLGWELWHGPLAIRSADGLLPTPNEQVMILRLARTPQLDLNSRLTAEWRQGELW